jgi:Protein of unknown function (DUF2490)
MVTLKSYNMKPAFLCLLFFFSHQAAFTQEGRITDRNTIGWHQLFVFVKLNKQWGMHGEYQWRSAGGIKNGQQGLFRTALQFRASEQVSAQLGYAEAETFSYGDYPIANNGRFPEHRIYQQLLLQQPFKKIQVTHRFRLEQRFLGKIKPGTKREIENWTFLHRFRYLVRVQQPVYNKKNTRIYLAAANELFIGAGKKLGINVFDQNRLMFISGIKSGKHIQVEAGFLQQVLQQGRLVNNRAVFQKNTGWLLSLYINR